MDRQTNKISPVFYRTLSLWGRCPAYNRKIFLKNEKPGKGTADHILTLVDLLSHAGNEGFGFRKTKGGENADYADIKEWPTDADKRRHI